MHTVSNEQRPSLLRQRGHADSGKVEMVELFFDLVFVFAVTQLSHTLLADLGAHNALQVGLLLLAVWWVWIYTSWVTNWLAPSRPAVRTALFGLMLGGLVLSASIPQAFGAKGWAFALAYVGMQVGRTLFMLWALRGESRNLVRNFQRILVWLLVSGVCWLLGGWADGSARLGWWALALAIEFISPTLRFWVPGLGRSSTQDWSIDGSHMSERCALFVIIALGESLLVSGATFAGLDWNVHSLVPFIATFAGTVAMWWLYFANGLEQGHHHITHSSDPGRLARTVANYQHLLIVAGVIVCAVADELVLLHPDHADSAGLLAILGGPVLYLVGTMLFKWTTGPRRNPPLSHTIGLVLLAGLVAPAFGFALGPLGLSIACTCVLWLVVVWEAIALRRP
jgi:low temperature requirement protein LtrA